MVTFKCRTCNREGELEFGLPKGWFWCSEECYREFAHVVDYLKGGREPAEIDVDPRSRLFCEALKDVQAHHRAEGIGRRELRERDWQRTRPRPFRPLYPC
jgi:hypothetical protein